MKDKGRGEREHPRYNIENVKGSISYLADAIIINMSIDGAAIETTKSIIVGREHTFNIIDKGQSLKLNAKTVWCVLSRSVKNERGEVIPIYRAGIRFKDVLDEKAKEIFKFIETKRRKKEEKGLVERFRLSPNFGYAQIDHPHEFVIKDIGISGMWIESETQIELGSIFDIRVELNGNIFKAQSKCVYVRELSEGKSKSYHMWIEFLEMSKSDKEVLISFIKNIGIMPIGV